MKTTLYILALSVVLFSATTKEDYIDPTGTYQLGKKRKAKKEMYAYFGKIKVQSLSKGKIAIRLDVNSGAPGYNSGTFADTLTYTENRAIYKTVDDFSCKITLDFSKKGVMVKQEAADLNYSCGFGQGVVLDDYFKKKSSKDPVFGE